MHKRPVLTRVEVAPRPTGLMIVQSCGLAAFGTGELDAGLMLQVHIDIAVSEVKFDPRYMPRCGDPKDLGVKLMILHARKSATPQTQSCPDLKYTH
jgi:hypothetical protein